MYFLFYGINPEQSEHPSFFLLSFRYPNDVQITSLFTGAIFFWKEQDLEEKEASKRRPEGQKRWAHAALVPDRMGPLNLGLEPPTPLIFLLEASS